MTKAQELGITNFPYHEYDEIGRETYHEYKNGFWVKTEHDSSNNIKYSIDSHGYWDKFMYDKLGNIIFFENSDGYWEKNEYDLNNNKICFENSNNNNYFVVYENNQIIKVHYENVKSYLRNYRLEQLLK